MTPIDALQQLFLRAGAGWVLWLLGLLSVVSVALTVERWLVLRARGGDLRLLAGRVGNLLQAGDRDGALRLLADSPSVAAAIAAAGLRLADRGPKAAEYAMQSALALERGQLERGLIFLGTLGNNAPFVGLLGTVIGVIAAFEELGHAAPGHGGGTGAASQVASNAVMSSIAEALVATAVGLLVALPAVAAYNAFQRRITSLCQGSEALTNLVLAYMSEKPGPEGPAEAR
ncbi:MotA/TolQ/ExbB proton channel family protein [Nannocystis bainbridge]|uniref:MotA/TolQ/ExbB proton channel family protein n=1 Tax=Nannocystis bainbridge TaxID=2995303 RepID=A0ABT5DZ13_9BACT|nr:MotA/TolQ/ExbB proton channel family protein [Nannocystis bainbridge]MDC0718871.1 MotA/TolQ/ExbB proton channel family protein [Nannocystis bainbridge]